MATLVRAQARWSCDWDQGLIEPTDYYVRADVPVGHPMADPQARVTQTRVFCLEHAALHPDLASALPTQPRRALMTECFRPHCDRDAMFSVTLPSQTREVPTCSAHVAGVLRSTPIGHTTSVRRVSTR